MWVENFAMMYGDSVWCAMIDGDSGWWLMVCDGMCSVWWYVIPVCSLLVVIIKYRWSICWYILLDELELYNYNIFISDSWGSKIFIKLYWCINWSNLTFRKTFVSLSANILLVSRYSILNISFWTFYRIYIL